MPSHQIEMLFLDLAVILLLARALAALAQRVGQPPVIGEILAGIALGPTLFHGSMARTLFPSDIRPLLSALASVGVALFMFTIGLEINHRALRGTGRIAAASAAGSTLVPFLLGLGLAAYLLHAGTADTTRTGAFTVFIALSVSVTAFPVLARILADRRLSTTPLGSLALATAAIVDIAAWIALAALQAATGTGTGHWRVALVLPYTAALILIVRPLLARVLRPTPDSPRTGTSTGSSTAKGTSTGTGLGTGEGTGSSTATGTGTGLGTGEGEGAGGGLSSGQLAVILTGALLSGAATEAMNLHYIFGAFLFGAVIPRNGTDALRTTIHERTTHITGLLLPVYFVTAGLNVDLNTLGVRQLTSLAVIMATAIAGKYGGTYLGARTQHLPHQGAATLATLMNTRGLTELIILGVGLQMGLLDTTTYTLMTAMAILTTTMTGPLLTRALRRQNLRTPDDPEHPAPDPGAARRPSATA